MSYQSSDIVEALVREYLVRAGCTSALEGFNREKPKHANSITKREVLRKSLGLDKASAYYKKQNPTADGLPSTLEVWVIHQMAKLGATSDAVGSALLPAPRPAPGLVRPIPRAATEPDEVSVPMAAPGLPRRPSAGSGIAPAANLSSAAPATASQGAVPAWRRRGLDALRKGSMRSRSKKVLLTPKLAAVAVPGVPHGPSGNPLAPLTPNRSRRSLSRAPSVMPRLAPIPQIGAKAAAPKLSHQSAALMHLPPLRGAVKHRPSSRANALSHVEVQGQPHTHAISGTAGTAESCFHGHKSAGSSMNDNDSPHKAHTVFTSNSCAPALSTITTFTPSTTTISTAAAAATVSTPTSSTSTTTATESDLRMARWTATASSSHEGPPARPVPLRQGFGFGDAVPPRQAAPTTARRISSTPSVENDSDGEAEVIHHGMARASAGGMVRASPQGSMQHSASASNVSLRASAPGLGLAAGSAPQVRSGSGATLAASGALAPPRAHVANRPDGARLGMGVSRHRGEMVMEDVGDINFDDESDGGAAAGVATMRISGPATRKPGTAISPDVLRQVKQLLWGAQGQPPPSWKQGFFFNRHPGLQFGLLQKQGGPCGVLAAVQALVLAALHSPATGFNTTPRGPEQQSALASAITESLWQARMGPTAALVLPEGEAGGAAGRLGYEQLCRAVAQHTATSKEALLDLVRSSLSVLMSEDGWGVVLLVMSLVLSRGVDNVRADMDEPSNSLMGMHGYCTQELVNMIILGVANSNVFDGNKHLDGSTMLKGISRRCRVGLLTLFEWYKYVEVGASLKNPTLPVWVICSESHFTVLFAQDSRALQNQLPFDLYYYDELANQESIIRLSVTKDPRGGWTARVGSSFNDRGKCEGQNIPPLECVIETRWPGVKVNWNGHEAIL
ncbi:hypothetical protein VaNZ11_017059 [Volvox africanus]|uniref:Probable ubiquitin carboxyl-terminal hydrolase MINDY-4 n=1 Tax=Volvox africanus TaxID=51714 RepID=A0ABQ5SPN0_9CHLO|nr:hypothetical protein VaNZ11_017059 [Volvox africanus]